MMFVFDTAIKDLILQNPNDANIIAAIDTIAYGRRKGNHIILSDRELLETIIEMPGISSNSKGVYKNIYSRSSTKRALLNTTNIYVRLCVPGTLIELMDEGTQKVITVPIDIISDSELMSPTKILAENIDECQLYEFFGSIFMDVHRICGSNIRYEPEHGGGQDIWRVYSKIQDSQDRFCISIADTDKKHPDSQLGNTAKCLLDVERSDRPLTNVEILNVHELENLFPPSIYNAMTLNDGDKLNCVAGMKKLNEMATDNPLIYFDIKKGLKVGDIAKNPDAAGAAYWHKISDAIGELYTCCNSNSCGGISKRCNHYIIKAWGGTAFKDIVAFVSQHKSNILNLIDEDFKTIWLNIGEIIYSWCCSGQPIRT